MHFTERERAPQTLSSPAVPTHNNLPRDEILKSTLMCIDGEFRVERAAGKKDSSPIIEKAKKEAESIRSIDDDSLKNIVKSIVSKVVIKWQ